VSPTPLLISGIFGGIGTKSASAVRQLRRQDRSMSDECEATSTSRGAPTGLRIDHRDHPHRPALRRPAITVYRYADTAQ